MGTLSKELTSLHFGKKLISFNISSFAIFCQMVVAPLDIAHGGQEISISQFYHD